MKILKDGTVEGTPEELAAYQAASIWQRESRTGLPIVFDPFPLPLPPTPPSHAYDAIPWSRQGCDACRNGGACGCVLSGPVVR